MHGSVHRLIINSIGARQIQLRAEYSRRKGSFNIITMILPPSVAVQASHSFHRHVGAALPVRLVPTVPLMANVSCSEKRRATLFCIGLCSIIIAISDDKKLLIV